MTDSKAKTVLRTGLPKMAAAHVVLGFLLALQIIIYEAWSLITPDVVDWRWVATLAFLAVAITVWILSSVRARLSPARLEALLWLLIAAGIALASFSVYTQRGMAARAVALYALPIVASALFSRATPLFLTAGLAVVAYVITAVSYFVINFSEGFQIELYGEVGFYSLFFLILAAAIWVVSKPKRW